MQTLNKYRALCGQIRQLERAWRIGARHDRKNGYHAEAAAQDEIADKLRKLRRRRVKKKIKSRAAKFPV